MSTSIYKHHYVYRITNIVLNKHYYGVRSCDIDPKDDIGFKYFSSSSDKDFIREQKEFPSNYKYKVVKLVNNRKKAITLEIKLHNKFDVGINESFYNRAKQTSTGFDTTGTTFIGTPLSYEQKEHLRNLNTGLNNPNYGIKRSDKTKQKISESNKNKIVSEETRQKQSIAQLGKKQTKETIEKRMISRKGYKHSDKTIEKINIAAKKRSGKNNINFKGLYVLDGQMYDSYKVMAHSLDVGQNCVVRVFKSIDVKISNTKFLKNDLLNMFGSSIIGKTPREIGFEFISKEEIIRLSINNFIR